MIQKLLRLKSLVLLALCCLLSANAWADATYDFSSNIPSGWTASVAPYGYETSGSARGTQFTSSSVLTLSGVSNVTSVTITCSANVAGSNTIEVSVGGTSWGTETLAKEANVEKTFTGTAASGDLVITLTRNSKSIYIKQIVVSGTTPEGGDTDPETSDLDEDYTYAEPTTLTPCGDSLSNSSYTFVQNNVKVTTALGGENSTYFGCNAGSNITFTTTKAMKSIVINGYVKKDFSATVDNGTVTYSDASDDAVEANPVLIVKGIDATSCTISCDKQLRCYSATIYFDADTDAEIEDPASGDDEETYTFDYEPTEATTLNIDYTNLQYLDYYADYGLTDLYFTHDDYEMDLYVFTPVVEGTGIAPGTYEITSTYEEGTVQASPGGDDYYDYPSYIATGFEYDSDYESWYYTEAYYLVSGTLTVEANAAGVKMTLKATTAHGSTVNCTYTGAVTEYSGDEDAIQNVETVNKPTQGKYLVDGKIVIRHNGHTYSTNGIRLK